jgi:hypothetical protein
MEVVTALTYTLALLIGFISGKLMAAVQFAYFKKASKADTPETVAKKTIDKLVRFGK